MVTIMLLWSISLLPLALGNDDLPQLQVKIIKESKGSFNNYVDIILPFFDPLPAYSTWTSLVVYPERGQKRTFLDHLSTSSCPGSY